MTIANTALMAAPRNSCCLRARVRDKGTRVPAQAGRQAAAVAAARVQCATHRQARRAPCEAARQAATHIASVESQAGPEPAQVRGREAGSRTLNSTEVGRYRVYTYLCG